MQDTSLEIKKKKITRKILLMEEFPAEKKIYNISPYDIVNQLHFIM